jgi:hypothetical protein
MRQSHSYFSLHYAAAAATALLFTLVLTHSQFVATNGRDNGESKSQVDHNLPVRPKITHSLLVSLGIDRGRS